MNTEQGLAILERIHHTNEIMCLAIGFQVGALVMAIGRLISEWLIDRKRMD